MNIHHKARHILIAGKSGTGKTTYALKYIAGSHHRRVFVFDHQGEIAPRLGLPALTRLEEIPRHAEKFRHVIYDPSEEYGGEFQEGFETFCDVVFQMARHLVMLNAGSLFVCDEIQKFVKPSHCPVEFKNIVETGRRQMLDSLSMSQQPNSMHTAVREQATELVLFKLQDENSLKFAASVGADVAAVMNLPPHHFLFFNTMTGDERGGKLEFRGKGSNGV